MSEFNVREKELLTQAKELVPGIDKHVEVLKKKIAEAIILAQKHGTRSEELRRYVQANQNVPELVDLVATVMVLMEEKESEEGED